MSLFDPHIRNILNQIRSSYIIFQKLEDKPGDLDILKKEWIKVNSLLNFLIKRIEYTDKTTDTFQNLLKKCKHYTQNYYFNQEIATMSALYENDTNRIKNIRLKILESFDDKKFIETIIQLAEKLNGT